MADLANFEVWSRGIFFSARGHKKPNPEDKPREKQKKEKIMKRWILVFVFAFCFFGVGCGIGPVEVFNVSPESPAGYIVPAMDKELFLFEATVDVYTETVEPVINYYWKIKVSGSNPLSYMGQLDLYVLQETSPHHWEETFIGGGDLNEEGILEIWGVDIVFPYEIREYIVRGDLYEIGVGMTLVFQLTEVLGSGIMSGYPIQAEGLPLIGPGMIG